MERGRDRKTMMMKARIRKRKQTEAEATDDKPIEYTAETSGLPKATLSAAPALHMLGAPLSH